MSSQYDVMGDAYEDQWCQSPVSPGGIPFETLKHVAEEFLGPDRSLEDLDPRERNVLIAEIEADMLGIDERLQIVPHTPIKIQY